MSPHTRGVGAKPGSLSASTGALAWGGGVDLARSLDAAEGGSRGPAPDRATRRVASRRVTNLLAFALVAAHVDDLGARYAALLR